MDCENTLQKESHLVGLSRNESEFLWQQLHFCSPAYGVWLLEETTIFQIFLDDDVGYGIKHKLDVLCVCGTRHVGVDFFDVPAHVQVQELHLNVVPSILVSVGAYKGEHKM